MEINQEIQPCNHIFIYTPSINIFKNIDSEPNILSSTYKGNRLLKKQPTTFPLKGDK